MIPRLQTEEELDSFYTDADAASEQELMQIVGGQPSAAAPAPAPAPAPAAPFNPAGFDWTQGTQNIGGFTYQPIYNSTGQGETFEQGPLTQVLRYREGETGVGKSYDILDPTTWQKSGTGQFKEVGNLGDMLQTAAQDFAPLATFALGVGPLGGMLGGSIASALGIPVAASAGAAGLSAAQVAALGSAAGGAGIGLAQGKPIGDVLEYAAKAVLPSFVLPQIPSTGTPAVDAAIKAGAKVAMRGGDVGSAVVGSLIDSGVGGVTSELGLDPKLVNFAIKAAQSEGDPSKIFGAITGLAASQPTAPTPSETVGGYGGAEISGFYDPEEETPSYFPEFDQPLLTAEPPAPAPSFTPPSDEVYEDIESLLARYEDQGYATQPTTAMPAMELNRFLEANIEDPGTVETLMQEYYPELYRQQVEVTGTPTERELFPEFDHPLLTAEPPAPASTPAPSPAPAPTPAATPAPSPAAAAKKKKDDLALLMMLSAMMTPQQKQEENYQLARILNLGPMDLLV